MSETAGERLSRLLTLVPWLRANNGITIVEAAEHFGVDVDQLTTDLWQLIVCGIPGYGPDQLVDIQFWDDDRIDVIDAITLDRPLRLTGEEVAALVVALRVLAQVPGDHDKGALLSAMTKLATLGAPEVPIGVDVRVDARIVESVAQAVATGTWMLIDYASADSDVITTRRIQPKASFTVDGRVYVQAWCELAAGLRTFRLDRILAASPTDPLPEHTGGDFAATWPTQVRPARMHQARVVIDPEASWILDTEPVGPAAGTKPSGAVEATIEYASLDWLVRWVLGHGGLVQVLEPPAARQAVRTAARERLDAG